MPRALPKRNLLEKDLLPVLHGTALDDAGNDLYSNGEIVRDLLAHAEGDTHPHVFIVDASLKWSADARICAGCHSIFGRSEMKTCTRCKIPYYCSVQCQKEHWKMEHQHGFCAHGRDMLAYIRPVFKALDTIERIIVEKNASFTDTGMQTNAPDSPLRVFMQEHGIVADTFMAIPSLDSVGIAFFKSERLLAYLESEFKNAIAVARSREYGDALRENARGLAKDLRLHSQTIKDKKPGQLLVMGSFSGYSLAIERMKITMHGRFFSYAPLPRGGRELQQ